MHLPSRRAGADWAATSGAAWLRAIAVCVGASLFLGACGSSGRLASKIPTVIRGGETLKIGRPYQVAGVWYYPKDEPRYDRTGVASWYGKKFHGRHTANGEIYDMNAMTAAHKTLALPTYVKVTNLENGRSIVLRVNDRGPFVHGRIIDVSRRGAYLLGFQKQGTARVRVQAVGRVKERFVLAKAQTTAEERNAVTAAPRTKVMSQPLEAPDRIESTPAEPAEAQPIATDEPADVQTKWQRQEIARAPVKPTQMFVQAGAFTNWDNAKRLQSELGRYGQVKILPINVDGQQFYRVRIGPMGTVNEADSALAGLISNGNDQARIVVETCPC